MNLPSRIRSLPLPLSAIAMLLAIALGTFDYNNAGWLLFGLGVLAWIKLDAKQLLSSDRYGVPPALALLAYPALAGARADTSVTFGLALHALVVLLILLSQHLAEGTVDAFSHQKGVSRSI
ncbi:hypothetical protein [Duganella aceris]|uniref:Phosphatidate cytidylyltransferase n=1 Tax=Duganella aceris TaxID=2703883 RepID=A0ABX0FS53_9BURK|nr:hypothetical protein [Duganella aceris]NGZ87308.1 hypothetical protein [Duganella aceris]